MPHFLDSFRQNKYWLSFSSKLPRLVTILLKEKYYLRFGSYLALILPKLFSKYQNLKECPNFLMYTMDIQVLTEFQLKITMIGETISKKVILPQIRPIFGILWPKLFRLKMTNIGDDIPKKQIS